MPAAIDHPVVRQQVRLLYHQNGKNLSEAARLANIPLARAEKWKQRDPTWDISPTGKKDVSENVRDVTDSVVEQLNTDSKATRLGFSKAARKVAESLPNKSETQLLDKDTAQSAKHWAGVAAQAQPGWEQEKKADGGLVSVALIRLELPDARMRMDGAGSDPAERAKIVHATELPAETDNY